jgi:uncharacterized LabA/DUF88 family protein
MPVEPSIKRAVAFVDGQNLFYHAKAAFGHQHPNYDIARLAQSVCAAHGWQFTQARSYTGVPEVADKPFWNHFWVAKLAQLGRDGVHVFSRPLRYRNQTTTLPGGAAHSVLIGQEKGIDVRLALDIVSMAWRGDFDVALVFSQDQDLSEVADELREIGIERNRWIKIACAFPFSPTSSNRRGINGTDWIRLDRAAYDACLDPRDYRPKKP